MRPWAQREVVRETPLLAALLAGAPGLVPVRPSPVWEGDSTLQPARLRSLAMRDTVPRMADPVMEGMCSWAA
jgi:hypothetical protein